MTGIPGKAEVVDTLDRETAEPTPLPKCTPSSALHPAMHPEVAGAPALGAGVSSEDGHQSPEESVLRRPNRPVPHLLARKSTVERGADGEPLASEVEAVVGGRRRP